MDEPVALGGDDPGSVAASVLELTYGECIALLQVGEVGRIAVFADPFPVVLPVNYRLVQPADAPSSEPGHAWIAIRTRPGNVIDRAPRFVAFEIDGIDALHRVGWSVLVSGTLERLDPDAAGVRERFDPEPWIDDERHAWLAVHPVHVTGRRIPVSPGEWAFNSDSYL